MYARLAAAHEQIGDAFEGLDGFHTSTVPSRRMAFYTEQIVPRLTNVALGTKAFGKVRAQVCAPDCTATSSSWASDLV